MLKLCAGRIKRATFQWRATQRLPLRAEPGRWDAEVIKIEGLDGDPIRRVRPIRRPDIPPNFEIDNHSKQSVAIDFSKPAPASIRRSKCELCSDPCTPGRGVNRTARGA